MTNDLKLDSALKLKKWLETNSRLSFQKSRTY